MKRYGILLPIAAMLIFAASCSLDQLGDSLSAMGTNILGPAPVDATSVTKIADNATATDLTGGGPIKTDNGSVLINTGNKEVRIEGINLTQVDTILSDLSANEIASIGMTLEVQGDSSALFDAMKAPVSDEAVLDGLHGTASIFSGIIDSISSQLGNLPSEVGDPIREISSGLKALSSGQATKGDLLLLQITQSLVFDVLDVVTDAEGELLTDFNMEMLEGESVQSVISSAGVLIGFAQVLQNGNETAGNQSLITTVNDLLDQLQDYIDNLGNAGGEAV